MSNLLAVEIAGLRLPNPTMLAAGVIGLSSASLLDVAKHGAGALVTKSIGFKPRVGYANPAVVQVDCGWLNSVGLANPGARYFAEEIGELKNGGLTIPLVTSVFGFSGEEFAKVASVLSKAGADAVELNVSCPHVEKTGSEIGQDPSLVAEVVKAVKGAIDRPVFVKLTPNVASVVEVAQAAVRAGADGITATNTVRAMAIDVETARPILSNKIGGLSGSAVKPIALRCVYEIFDAVDVPVIGCGGIRTWRDAAEFMLAGASAVQLGTAVATDGLRVFKSLTKGLEEYVRRKGFRSVKEIVGLSHRR